MSSIMTPQEFENSDLFAELNTGFYDFSTSSRYLSAMRLSKAIRDLLPFLEMGEDVVSHQKEIAKIIEESDADCNVKMEFLGVTSRYIFQTREEQTKDSHRHPTSREELFDIILKIIWFNSSLNNTFIGSPPSFAMINHWVDQLCL